ncbi:hypothetical protein EJ04DRAFT_562881 [Polyplosphaeria fusca]|uniref:Uncharacterized protein n=1 Tax=Polyplosphaeria fusca TaxID=682080 RepID=A0A9P4V2T8_9PLEO|nr:hypothetical protein EJ04DRAFT_562881 [Polyplosphaeria fusca]
MAGYGNRTAEDLSPADLEEHHSNTRYGVSHSNAYSGGHDTYGSGATGGAGFGNKSSSDPDVKNNSEFRFGSHQNGDPYSGSTQHGSGTTGGAGFGNKTGSFSESHDSTVGKLMEKAGHIMHNEKLAEKGHAKREAQGLGQNTE